MAVKALDANSMLILHLLVEDFGNEPACIAIYQLKTFAVFDSEHSNSDTSFGYP
jgi:hypothetical protein